jgi:hypothetical protein
MRSAVAVAATEYPVIGVGRSEGFGRFPMTGPALGGGNMSLRHNLQRPVGSMAEAAVRLILRGKVRRMALQTPRQLAVPAVTVIAEQFGMPAGRRSHLFADLRVTGQAGPAGGLDRVAQGNERLMGIDVTVPAISDSEMRLSVMTGSAGENRLPAFGGMLGMTVETADSGRVSTFRRGHRPGDEAMALSTVFRAQRRFFFGPRSRQAPCQQQEQDTQDDLA